MLRVAILAVIAVVAIVRPGATGLPQCEVDGCAGEVSATVRATSTQSSSSPAGATQPNTPERVCRQRVGTGSDTQVVSCVFQGGWWVDRQQCYVKILQPQPPKSDPVWLGQATGGIYMCVALGADATYLTRFFWALTQPPEIPTVDPAALARQAVAALNLQPIRIGMVPEDKPGAVGIVGMPVWMWVDEPDPRTYGPATNTATDGALSVSITAKVSSTRWDMGDGQVVTCRTAGSIYEDRFGKQMSPDCGYRYSSQGSYTIRAVTTWDIAWTASTGQAGSIPLTLTATRTVVIGEVQVLRK